MAKKEKNSFIIYYDWEPMLEGLTTLQKGEILEAMFAYEMRGEKYSGTSGEVRMALNFIFAMLDRNRIHYEETCRKRREAAEKRWKDADDADASKSIICSANDADKDNEKVNEKVNEKGNEKGNEKVNEKEKEPAGAGDDPSGDNLPPGEWTTEPTEDEVYHYMQIRGYRMDWEKWCQRWAGHRWKTPLEWQKQVDGWAAREYPGKYDHSGESSPAQVRAYRAGLDADREWFYKWVDEHFSKESSPGANLL